MFHFPRKLTPSNKNTRKSLSNSINFQNIFQNQNLNENTFIKFHNARRFVSLKSPLLEVKFHLTSLENKYFFLNQSRIRDQYTNTHLYFHHDSREPIASSKSSISLHSKSGGFHKQVRSFFASLIVNDTAQSLKTGKEGSNDTATTRKQNWKSRDGKMSKSYGTSHVNKETGTQTNNGTNKVTKKQTSKQGDKETKKESNKLRSNLTSKEVNKQVNKGASKDMKIDRNNSNNASNNTSKGITTNLNNVMNENVKTNPKSSKRKKSHKKTLSPEEISSEAQKQSLKEDHTIANVENTTILIDSDHLSSKGSKESLPIGSSQKSSKIKNHIPFKDSTKAQKVSKESIIQSKKKHKSQGFNNITQTNKNNQVTKNNGRSQSGRTERNNPPTSNGDKPTNVKRNQDPSRMSIQSELPSRTMNQDSESSLLHDIIERTLGEISNSPSNRKKIRSRNKVSNPSQSKNKTKNTQAVTENENLHSDSQRLVSQKSLLEDQNGSNFEVQNEAMQEVLDHDKHTDILQKGHKEFNLTESTQEKSLNISSSTFQELNSNDMNVNPIEMFNFDTFAKEKSNSINDNKIAPFRFPILDLKAPPYHNTIFQKFFQILDKLYLENNGFTRIGMSFSSSWNDMSLFILLYYYCNNRRIDFWVCLIDSSPHSIQKDALLWIHAWLKRLNVQHSIFQLHQNIADSVRPSSKRSDESALRRELFISESKKRKVDLFCTSHTLTDRVETFLHRWTTDSHLKGLITNWETVSGKDPRMGKPLLNFKDLDLKNFLIDEFQWDATIYPTIETEGKSNYIRQQWEDKISRGNHLRDIMITEDSFLPLFEVLQATNAMIEEKVQAVLSRLEVNWVMRFIKIPKQRWILFQKLEPYIQMRVFASIITFVSGQQFHLHETRLKNLIHSMQSGHTRTLGNAQFTSQHDGWIITKEVRGTKSVVLDLMHMCTRTKTGEYLGEVRFDFERKEFIAKWDHRFEIRMKINEEYFSLPDDYRHISLLIRPWDTIHDDPRVKSVIDAKRVPNGYYVNRIYLGSLPCITNDGLTCLYIPHISLTLGHIFSNVEVHPIYQRNVSDNDNDLI